MRTVLLSTIICLFFNFILSGQSEFCGTAASPEEVANFDHAAFRAFQETRAKQRNPEKVFMGISAFIVKNTSTVGASGTVTDITIQDLFNSIDEVNRAYALSNVEFYLCGSPRFIDGKGLYSYGTARDELNARKHIPNTINIFYIDDIGAQVFDRNFIAGISTFPWRGKSKDRFIIMKKEYSKDGPTLAHELGHFLGLLHTHEPANGLEFVNGTNCSTAGDQVCDTPADPNLGNTGLNGCAYEANVVDPNGEPYTPNPRNIMSYAASRCQDLFTVGQTERMHFFIETTELAEIITDCDFYPDYAIATAENKRTITSGQILEIPYTFDNQGITEDQTVDIHWRLAQAGELELTIQKDVLALTAGSGTINKTFKVEFPISKGTGSYTLTAVVDPDSKVIERDKRNNFHEIALTVDNSQFSDILLFPNPANDQLKVFARDGARGGDITLQIIDYMGRIYYEEKKFKRGDEFFAQVNIEFLAAGLYYLNVRYDRDGISQPFLFLKE